MQAHTVPGEPGLLDKWEEGNPLEIEEWEKPVLIATRRPGVYRKAVIHMRYCPEI